MKQIVIHFPSISKYMFFVLLFISVGGELAWTSTKLGIMTHAKNDEILTFVFVT